MLVHIGLLELAFGALFGWVVAGTHAAPRLFERLGVISPRRILQAHLDYVIMGVILIAVGTAVPRPAAWIVPVLVFGTLLNPTLFLPLAFREQLTGNLGYRVVSAVSFAATSVGLVAVAVTY
ncbi:hypothetical protein ACWDSJ_10175 [Nocardia sp. NPDC003482]|uniref:hypothetical protein n=1 Tax=Nocardia sp. NPDC004068 TaxID=3364303 RepID=UPI0036B19A63